MPYHESNSPLFIQKSFWAIENIIETPLNSMTTNSVFLYINTFSFVFRTVLQLEKIFTKKKNRIARKVGQDQLNIFRVLEKTLERTGIDGRACLMRTICEIQQSPLNHYSIMGEIIMTLLTPKRAAGNMMHEYLEAERLGKADPQSCSTAYSTCPISVFNLARTYSTPADKPAKKQSQHEDDHYAQKRIDIAPVDDPPRVDPSVYDNAVPIDII